jgi:hypothetical protein
MTLIADIIHDVTANPAPVLFLDTCVLLDIVRAPLRNKPSEVLFARLFLTAVQKTPKTIHLVVASPTQTEPWLNAFLYACVRFVASSRPVMRYAKEASDITRCSAIGLLPQRASPATARSGAWGTM